MRIKQQILQREPKYTLARLMPDGEEIAHDVGRKPYPTYSRMSAAKADAKLLNSLGPMRWKYVVIEL